MKKDIRIKHYGNEERGTILFFFGKFKYHRYYRSILQALSEHGYLVLAIPYGIKNYEEEIKNTLTRLNKNIEHVILMSHERGDERIYRYAKKCEYKVDKVLVTAPTWYPASKPLFPTLVLWADKYKPVIAMNYFAFQHKYPNIKFIGYPNVTKYLFAGVGYSRYHDRYDRRQKKIFFNAETYTHIEQDVLDDIFLFLEEGRVKDKLAIFCENYLPFNSGVNILTYVLKTELEKVGKKVYPVTLKLKGVNYEDFSQDKNVIVFPSVPLPGKAAAKEALVMSLTPVQNMNRLRAYQFTYIQMQTEFTIGKAALLLRKKDNIPLMYTAHTMWNDMMNKRFPKPIAGIINFTLNHFLLNPPLKYADLMTVPTEKVKKYYMENLNKKEPIVVIPGCVDGQNFALSEDDLDVLGKMKETYQLNDKVVIGYIGRVSKEKNIDQVFDYFEKAAEEIDNLVLMVVGDGPYYDEVLKRSRNSKFAERIIFVGGVPNNTLKYYYRLFTAFCTASTFETQGLTYIESMWCGTPILARQDHCLDHFLANGVNGITFTDYETWKEGLFRIINDKKFVLEMVSEAYKTAYTYAKDVWAKRMYYLYEQAKLLREGMITEINYPEFKSIK